MGHNDASQLRIHREHWPGYEDLGRTWRVKVGDIVFGGPRPVVIGGPCAVESMRQALDIARAVRAAGGDMLRGGVYKPRTDPYSFPGLGLEGLKILDAIREETGLGIVTEVMDPRLVEQVAGYADMLQIGSRSMQNFPLLTEVGRSHRPVLLKRGWASTLEEWLCAAEYIAKEGNLDIVLCERGIRASCHWSYARNVLDLNVISPLRRRTPLPVIVDPSHAAGTWPLVSALSRAALSAGAHGLLIETVGPLTEREVLRCDAEQGLPPDLFADVVRMARSMEVPPLITGVEAPA